MKKTILTIATVLLFANTTLAQTSNTAVDDAIKALDAAVQSLKAAVAPPPPPPCSYVVTAPANVPVTETGGQVFQATVTTGATCTWTASSSVPWLTLSSANGTGTGTITVTAAANAASARSGSVTVQGTSVAVNQAAAPLPPNPANPTDAASLAAALLKGGTIKLGPSRIVGNFVVTVDGTRIEGAQNLPAGLVPAGATSQYTIEGTATAPPVGQQTQPTLLILANNVTIVGVHVRTGPAGKTRAAIMAGSATVKDPLSNPDNVLLDRVEVDPVSGSTQKGVEAHTRKFTLINSRVTGFLLAGTDSQAFISWNGPGPYTLENNVLEGSGENIMFGGGTTADPVMIPSDIVIRKNLIRKPPEWRKTLGSVKNSVEFKAARRALVENNVIDGMWKDAQPGNACLITPRNQYGDMPWIVTEDITFRNNIIRNHTDGFAFSVLGWDDINPSQQTSRVTIEGNLADSPRGIILNHGVADYVRVLRNTFWNVKYNLLMFEDASKPTLLTYIQNVGKLGEYGFNGALTSPGNATIALYTAPGSQITSNILEKTPVRAIPMPAGNTMLEPGQLTPLLDPTTFKYLPGGFGY